MQSSRRVVITGIGIVSPLATGVDAAWQALLAGKSAVAPLNLAELCAPYTAAAVSALPVKVAARVRRGTSTLEFDLANYVNDAQVLGALRVSGTDSTHFAIGAAAQALRQADWLQRPNSEHVDELDDTCPSVRTGVALGVGGVGSMSDISTASSVMRDRGYSRVSAYFLPRILPNMVAGQVALHFGLRGPMHSSSAACATGAQCIGDAYHAILRGDADVMVAGGADASIDPLSMAGFVRCRALSGSDSLEASRPFHPKRDGFVMGEGAAVLILEDFEHAMRRRAPHIIAEVLGFATRSDPSHLTSPSSTGDAAYRVMRAALTSARLPASSVNYINAHATSTPTGDAAEVRAIRRFFGDATAVSSTKGATGHLLGAAGALESAFCALSVRDNVMPPSLHLGDADLGDCSGADIVRQTRSAPVNIAVNNSFGFGGANACVVFGKSPSQRAL